MPDRKWKWLIPVMLFVIFSAGATCAALSEQATSPSTTVTEPSALATVTPMAQDIDRDTRPPQSLNWPFFVLLALVVPLALVVVMNTISIKNLSQSMRNQKQDFAKKIDRAYSDLYANHTNVVRPAFDWSQVPSATKESGASEEPFSQTQIAYLVARLEPVLLRKLANAKQPAEHAGIAGPKYDSTATMPVAPAVTDLRQACFSFYNQGGKQGQIDTQAVEIESDYGDWNVTFLRDADSKNALYLRTNQAATPDGGFYLLPRPLSGPLSFIQVDQYKPLFQISGGEFIGHRPIKLSELAIIDREQGAKFKLRSKGRIDII